MNTAYLSSGYPDKNESEIAKEMTHEMSKNICALIKSNQSSFWGFSTQNSLYCVFYWGFKIMTKSKAYREAGPVYKPLPLICAWI